MIASTVSAPPSPIVYPESDGLPMADNSRQFFWIIKLADNLASVFHDRADVFVCGNQNWYPVEGEPTICAAPDVYAVFGRPKGHRSSYKQWEEGNLPMTVVFEVLSPSNSVFEMADKLAFYDEYGVEEYYLYDPESNRLHGYVRRGANLVRVRTIDGFVSPRLGIRFEMSGPELVVRRPDGRPFRPFEELETERRQTAQRAEQEKQRAEQEKQRAEQEKQRAEQEKQRAEQEKQRAEQEKQRAEQAEHHTARLAALTRKALRQAATAEELAELERLLQEPRS